GRAGDLRRRAGGLGRAGLEPGPERRPGHGPEHLVLVVDRPAVVGGHDARRGVGRDTEGVDVPRRDRDAEVVADEAAAERAGILVAGARVLREAADLLLRLVRV